jgi:hypothetical protein
VTRPEAVAAAALLVGALAGCASSGDAIAAARSDRGAADGVDLAVVKRSWHSQIEIPMSAVTPPLAALLPPGRGEGGYVVVGLPTADENVIGRFLLKRPTTCRRLGWAN